MSSQRDAQRHVCLGAIGATAILGLNAYGPQAFVTSPSLSGVPTHASPAVGTSGSSTRAGAVASSVAPAVGLAGIAVLAAKASHGRARADRTSKPLRAFETEFGVQPPVGFFDPLGMTKDGDVEAFKRRRATELKHGRVSMLACMGYIAPEFFRFPGDCAPSSSLAFKDIPNGLAALSKVPGAGWMQIFLFIGTVEKSLLVHDPARAPGDFENAGVLGVPNGRIVARGDDRKRRLNSELANGRLAMMAITGMFYQDGLTGSAWGDWSLFTDSPLRAFENELGVQAPVGYWDPMGLAKDGDVDVFRRRREAELKHGRVSMFAAMGYIVPEYFRFPGQLSPSEGIFFNDVPNGLAAFSKVPALGWAQIIVFCGLVDFGLYRQDPARAPGDYENGGILGVPNASGPMNDTEGRKRKLNAELANGRLAMVAIMGMMFQNGFLGTTGPEMWSP
mmetsp:Transcript_58489/g.131787  ORF Transcript_58489/g.131787 Transcript_58489/m.131787 type:complete len:448 (+) Transcript_58489:89-1432(+)